MLLLNLYFRKISLAQVHHWRTEIQRQDDQLWGHWNSSGNRCRRHIQSGMEGVWILQKFESSFVARRVKGQGRPRGFLMFLAWTLQCTAMLLMETGSHAENRFQQRWTLEGGANDLGFEHVALKHLLEGILRKHWEMWVGDQRGWSWAAVTGTKNGGWSHGNRRALSKWAVKSKKREGSRIEFWGRPKCTVRAGRGTEERKETEQGVQGDWGRVGESVFRGGKGDGNVSRRDEFHWFEFSTRNWTQLSCSCWSTLSKAEGSVYAIVV